jgi:DNA (cytosine-5)-methyltransferase 1
VDTCTGTAIHLCSGYGGFELAFKLAGLDIRTVCHVERDSHAAATLVARMESETLDSAPIWDDIFTFDGSAWCGKVDWITAGFPCQPFSSAGRKGGVDDDRWLWPSIFRIICDVGPSYVFLENVGQLVKHGLPQILADLASVGFDAEWGMLSAGEVGAPHRRDRFWLLAQRGQELEGLADASGVGGVQGDRPTEGASGWIKGSEACGDSRLADPTSRRWLQGSNVARNSAPSSRKGTSDDAARGSADGCRRLPDHSQWPPVRQDIDGWREWISQGGPEPAFRRVTNGRPAGLADSLHLGGNGLVPRVAAEALAELATRLEIGYRKQR